MSESFFEARRTRAREKLGARGALLLFATRVMHRNSDVEHEYRADSDVLYLTGFEEPAAAVLLLNAHERVRFVLFVRPRDPEHERWDGPRAGTEGALARYGCDAAHSIDELDDRLVEYLAGHDELFYSLGRSRENDERVLRVLGRVRAKARKSGVWPERVTEANVVLAPLRFRKGPEEIATMRAAAEITREGFLRAMQLSRAGTTEGAIEGALREVFRREGSERMAYAPIVASGPNACVLHYRANNRRIGENELLLIDAGCELGGYASDVTRTFPVSGRFTPPQRAIYDLVLRAQRAAHDAVRPGQTLEDVHRASVETLTDGLCALGLLSGDRDVLRHEEAHKRYFMHGTSHWLGLDVHDVGRYYRDGSAVTLEPGVVLTLEPGLYVSPDDEAAPPEFRGIGVRIEDDVVVTEQGCTVLTHDIPKEPEALEALLGARG